MNSKTLEKWKAVPDYDNYEVSDCGDKMIRTAPMVDIKEGRYNTRKATFA